MNDKQEAKFQELTGRPVGHLVCKMAVPTIISMMVTACYNMFHTKIGVKLCSMAGGGVSRNLWNFFRTAPAGTGQAVTCSTSGMGLRLK